jgi:hypothetical protein
MTTDRKILTMTGEKTKNMRKVIRCKGNRDGGQGCNCELCETDGTNLYMRLESGKELVVTPKKSSGFGLICDSCGYENIWRE